MKRVVPTSLLGLILATTGCATAPATPDYGALRAEYSQKAGRAIMQGDSDGARIWGQCGSLALERKYKSDDELEFQFQWASQQLKQFGLKENPCPQVLPAAYW